MLFPLNGAFYKITQKTKVSGSLWAVMVLNKCQTEALLGFHLSNSEQSELQECVSCKRLRLET